MYNNPLLIPNQVAEANILRQKYLCNEFLYQIYLYSIYSENNLIKLVQRIKNVYDFKTYLSYKTIFNLLRTNIKVHLCSR